LSVGRITALLQRKVLLAAFEKAANYPRRN